MKKKKKFFHSSLPQNVRMTSSKSPPVVDPEEKDAEVKVSGLLLQQSSSSDSGKDPTGGKTPNLAGSNSNRTNRYTDLQTASKRLERRLQTQKHQKSTQTNLPPPLSSVPCVGSDPNPTPRQDSNLSSDSFSQTSSPSYNSKTMEAPLLPHKHFGRPPGKNFWEILEILAHKDCEESWKFYVVSVNFW